MTVRTFFLLGEKNSLYCVKTRNPSTRSSPILCQSICASYYPSLNPSMAFCRPSISMRHALCQSIKRPFLAHQIHSRVVLSIPQSIHRFLPPINIHAARALPIHRAPVSGTSNALTCGIIHPSIHPPLFAVHQYPSVRLQNPSRTCPSVTRCGGAIATPQSELSPAAVLPLHSGSARATSHLCPHP
jgi:hypothetical protein